MERKYFLKDYNKELNNSYERLGVRVTSLEKFKRDFSIHSIDEFARKLKQQGYGENTECTYIRPIICGNSPVEDIVDMAIENGITILKESGRYERAKYMSKEFLRTCEGQLIKVIPIILIGKLNINMEARKHEHFYLPKAYKVTAYQELKFDQL